jgi:hypothetical protein
MWYQEELRDYPVKIKGLSEWAKLTKLITRPTKSQGSVKNQQFKQAKNS